MATYYGMNAGGNWGVAGTWSTSADKNANRAANPASAAPTTSDDCILDDYSGNITVNTTCNGKTLNCTVNGNYAGTLAFGIQTLIIAGSITFAATMSLTGTTGELRVIAAATITSAGLTIPVSVRFSAAVTYTLSGDLVTSKTFIITTANPTVAGAFNISCDTLSLDRNLTLTLKAGQTLTISTNLYINGAQSGAATHIKSDTASSVTYLSFLGTVANCLIFRGTFTDVDASGSAQGLDNWYGGTLTRTTNITNRTSADIGGGGGGGNSIIGSGIIIPEAGGL